MAKESYTGKINRKLSKKLHVVEVASGREEADLVLKNATYVNVYCNELSHGDIAANTSPNEIKRLHIVFMTVYYSIHLVVESFI